MKIKRKSLLVAAIVFIICMIVSITLTVKRTYGILNDNYENNQRIITALISNGITNDFLRPITVAETISKDHTTIEILKKKNQREAEEIETLATNHLAALRKGFGYSMVYAASDSSKAFFTPSGISKYVDIDDPADVWYKDFLEMDKYYDLNVDIDESADWSLSVFINTAVYDDDNNFIGVCGVAVNMEELQRMLERYERIYNVKIDLIDETGLIQIDSDTERIEKEYVEVSNLKNYSDGECYYEISKDGNRTITYMKDIDWYLVVQNNNSNNANLYAIIRPSIITLFIGIGLLIVIVLVIKGREHIDNRKKRVAAGAASDKNSDDVN